MWNSAVVSIESSTRLAFPSIQAVCPRHTPVKSPAPVTRAKPRESAEYPRTSSAMTENPCQPKLWERTRKKGKVKGREIEKIRQALARKRGEDKKTMPRVPARKKGRKDVEDTHPAMNIFEMATSAVTPMRELRTEPMLCFSAVTAGSESSFCDESSTAASETNVVVSEAWS